MKNPLESASKYVVAQENPRHPLSSQLWNPEVIADAAELFSVDKHELVQYLDENHNTQVGGVDLTLGQGESTPTEGGVDVASEDGKKPISASDILSVLDGLEEPEALVARALGQDTVAEAGEAVAGDSGPVVGDPLASLAAELGLDLNATILIGGVDDDVQPVPAETTPKATRGRSKGSRGKSEQSGTGTSETQPKPRKERVTKDAESGEAKPKKEPTTRIKMDAPIPVVQFRGLVIGVYGNILEPLAEKDAEGYEWKEIEKSKYSPLEYEQYRSKGRMVLVICESLSKYLVGVEEGDKFEGIIEVTNRGRGALRCRQLAQALEVAYLEKRDEIRVDADQYGQYLTTAPVPKMGLGA